MTGPKKKWFLVIGRITGDDEETPIVIEGVHHGEVVADYRKQMWEMNGASPSDVADAEAADRGCLINGVFVSESPIRISTGDA